MEITTPVGIALIVIGVFVALKAAKTVVKLLMIAVIAGGVYLWLAGDGARAAALSLG